MLSFIASKWILILKAFTIKCLFGIAESMLDPAWGISQVLEKKFTVESDMISTSFKNIHL